jgi:hypothetical protein
MDATFTWAVQSLDCYPQAQGEVDVVFNVNWTLTGVQEQDAKTYTYVSQGKTACTYTAGQPFTPYASLTQEQVLGWVLASLGTEGQAEAEAWVQAQIDAQITPTVIQPALPWSA